MPRFTIVWLDRESKDRCHATRTGEAAARDLARQLTTQGHGDVRFKRPGERGWRAVRVKGAPKVRRKREEPFPPTAKAMKEKLARERRSDDALERRVDGSFESGKRR